MSFGAELPDQVDLIAGITDNQLKLIGDLKDLFKERVVLERDYALKLQALARRGHDKQAKLSTALTYGETPTRSWGDGAAKKSTFSRAYDELLTSTEQQAMDHLDLADSLGTQVIDSLRQLESVTQERQSRQSAFYTKVLSERDRYQNERQNARQKYYEECKEFELYRQKQGRAQGDRHAERAAKQYEHQKLEMINYKNMYVVTTAAMNIVQQKFYESDVPRLEDQYQLLQARLINDIVAIVKRNEAIHLQHLDALRGRHTQIDQATDTIDPTADQALFIEFNRRPFAIPSPQEFEACPDFYDTGEISAAGDSKVFLQNKLARARGKLGEVRPIIENKHADIARYNGAITTNPPNVNEVVNNLVEAQHSATLMEIVERALTVEHDLISTALGDDEGLNQPHNFKSASFSLPSPCAYCNASIWGLSKQGKTCKDCGLSVHMKCELKIPADCPGGHGRGPTTSRVVIQGARSSTSSSISVAASPPTASTFTVGGGHDYTVSHRTQMIQFDYTASSPFELSVAEGDQVKVLEEDDGSGWVKVQDSDGTTGLIPASYLGDAAAAVTPRAASPVNAAKYVRGIYDYTAQGDDEMSIQAGQMIQLTAGPRGGMNYGEGWAEGIDPRTQRARIFPSNYVEPA